MKTSANGIKKITGYEGKLRSLGDGRYIAYRCPANVPTIYIGCTHGVHDGMIVTEAEGEAMFASEIEKFEVAVERLVKVPLNQNEFDALVSFTYNCGDGALERSSILARLNKGDRVGAARAFAVWNKARVNGRMVVLRGLVERRASEANLFLKPLAPSPEPTMPQAVGKSLEPPSRKTIGACAGTVALTVPQLPLPHSLPEAPQALMSNLDNAESWQSIGERIWMLKSSLLTQPAMFAALAAVSLFFWLRSRSA